MPAVLALPAFWAAVAGGTTAAGLMVSAKAGSHAADVNAEASKAATVAQTASADQALAFQKDQAEKEAARAEVNRHADYDQWAARERRLSTIGGMLGLPSRDIPGYVPTNPDGTPASGSNGSAPRPLATIDSSKPLDPQIRDYFKAQGVPDSETAYWVGKWPELEARGKELNDPAYAVKRLAAADIFGGGGGSAAKPTSRPPGSVAAMTAPASAPQTPAYVAPTVAYPGQIAPPGSVLSMTRQPRYGA